MSAAHTADHPPSDVRPVPVCAGIGLKPQHYEQIMETEPAVGWFEIHAENYMGKGGAPHAWLSRIAEHYPLSIHGVGLSLGRAGPLDAEHLERLAGLVARYNPGLVSEHVAWTGGHGQYLNDLLPIPYNAESLEHLCNHVDEVQTRLKRRILIENPSTYLMPKGSTMSEADFMVETARRSGCGLLLDINNVFVSATNHGFDPRPYIDAMPRDLVEEIHLAGHLVDEREGVQRLVDDHGDHVCDEVWDLYAGFVMRTGARPTLIEWDNRVPALDVWVEEAARADRLIEIAREPLLGSRHG